jgi:hypothetical protein
VATGGSGSGQVAKPLSCPPRTTPNAAHTRCIPELDMPDFGGAGSGSFAPGAGGRAPGGGGGGGAASPTHR